MIPVQHDIDVYRGDIYELFFRIRERVWNETTQAYEAGAYRVLTGWTGIAQVRLTADTADPPLFTMAVVISDQVTVPGGVLVTMSAAQSAGLTKPAIPQVYDVQLTNTAGEPRTYLAGKVIVTLDVSRV